MYNKELFERICAVECFEKELEDFNKSIDKQKYDLDNPFDKYYSLDSILKALELYKQGRISDRHLTSWACAYLWILQADRRVENYYDSFTTIPMKEVFVNFLIDVLDSLSFFYEEYNEDPQKSIADYAKSFTALDELYRSLSEWESFYAPDDDYYDEDDDDYCYSWVLFVHHGKKKFLRLYEDSFNCKRDNFEAKELTKEQMRNTESELKSKSYTELYALLGHYDLLYNSEASPQDFESLPTTFDDQVHGLYDRICNLTCTIDDLNLFDALETDYEEKNGKIINYTTPYDLDEPFKKYFNPQAVTKIIDKFSAKEIDRNFLYAWQEAYSQILTADTLNSIFFASKTKNSKKHLITKEEAIKYIISDYISNITIRDPQSAKVIKEIKNEFFTYIPIYRQIKDWQIVYSPIEKWDEEGHSCHRVLFVNDRIQQFFITYPEIGTHKECYYEGICCDKYDFEKICDGLRDRKYKEILVKNKDTD